MSSVLLATKLERMALSASLNETVRTESVRALVTRIELSLRPSHVSEVFQSLLNVILIVTIDFVVGLVFFFDDCAQHEPDVLLK